MSRRTNPFGELYVSETIPPREFVALFSAYLVPHTLPLFQPGNVVLKGVQGSGKSMLLGLYDPAIRLAYREAGAEFPVPAAHRRFLSAGINLRHSLAMTFGQRPIRGSGEDDDELFPVYFGDFLNYWIVSDLLRTLRRYDAAAPELLQEWGVDVTRLSRFAKTLAADRCWFGALEGVDSVDALEQALEQRIGHYFSFLNFNTDELPPSLHESKTVAGEPIARTARAMRDSGLIPHDLPIFVRIDQYEDLGEFAPMHGDTGGSYKRVVNRLLGMREGYVSYRVGVRPYAWREDLTMHGTRAQLEREREYAVLDLEEILRRKENRKTYLFPEFAEDVMRRRLRQSKYEITNVTDMSLLRAVFGQGVSTEEETRMYVSSDRSDEQTTKLLDVGIEWTREWRAFLLKLFQRDPFSAKLAAAWAAQSGGRRVNQPVPEESGTKPAYPWEREYWKKERKEQALLQLAGGNQQRLVWAGEADIIDLSGGNVLIFVSMCREIWAAWIRANQDVLDDSLGPFSLPQIPARIQTNGIDEASRQWYEKITGQPGGDTRQRFIDVLGTMFRRDLIEDRRMSYPGWNGFSVRVRDLDSAPDVRSFLNEAVDYGDLIDAPHTTKEKDKLPRLKYYLKPILSPRFGVPATHKKEPKYIQDIGEIRNWIQQAKQARVVESSPAKQPTTSEQFALIL